MFYNSKLQRQQQTLDFQAFILRSCSSIFPITAGSFMFIGCGNIFNKNHWTHIYRHPKFHDYLQSLSILCPVATLNRIYEISTEGMSKVWSGGC